jgi:hypothetical protein
VATGIGSTGTEAIRFKQVIFAAQEPRSGFCQRPSNFGERKNQPGISAWGVSMYQTCTNSVLFGYIFYAFWRPESRRTEDERGVLFGDLNRSHKRRRGSVRRGATSPAPPETFRDFLVWRDLRRLGFTGYHPTRSPSSSSSSTRAASRQFQ